MQAVVNGIIAEESGKEGLNHESCFHSVVDCILETILLFCIKISVNFIKISVTVCNTQTVLQSDFSVEVMPWMCIYIIH